MGQPMGLSQSHVTQMESGKKPLSIQSALCLVHHFDLTLDWLYRGDPSNLRLADTTILTAVQNQFLAGEKPEPPPTWSSLAKKTG